VAPIITEDKTAADGSLFDIIQQMSLDWTPAGVPPRKTHVGATVRLEPIDPGRHAQSLFAASHDDGAGELLFRHLPYGPFVDLDDFNAWLVDRAASTDPLFFAIVDHESGSPQGMASFLRMAPEHGVIEIGHIWFAPALQRTRQATEAIFLMARHSFDDLGYRRLEWKCDALNEPSRRAAERFGFTFEGVFRQHMVVKGRNRDSAWFSILHGEWPVIRSAFEAWLAPDNFDADGRQRQSLSAVRDAIRS
jgi:RimJ/RimL family protein N-acetyltransferase